MLAGLDLATRTGFCVGRVDSDALPRIGHVRLPAPRDDLGLALCRWEEWLTAWVREVEPSLLVFEAPILAGATNIATTRWLQGLAGVTEMVGHRAGIEVAEVATSQIKKALTGNGRAEKADMIAAARRYGLDPQTSDEADAFAVWLCALRLRFPRLAGRWDPLNFGRAA